MKCNKCVNRIVLHAFSDGVCEICDKVITYHSTPCTKICASCSEKHCKCEFCGGDVSELDLAQKLEAARVEYENFIEGVQEIHGYPGFVNEFKTRRTIVVLFNKLITLVCLYQHHYNVRPEWYGLDYFRLNYSVYVDKQ